MINVNLNCECNATAEEIVDAIKKELKTINSAGIITGENKMAIKELVIPPFILEDVARLQHETWLKWYENIHENIELMIKEIESNLNYWRNTGALVNSETIKLIESSKKLLEDMENLSKPYNELTDEEKDQFKHSALRILGKLILEYNVHMNEELRDVK